jgi:hypothetical protein
MNYRMELSTQENGRKTVRGTEEGFNSGLMALSMKDFGNLTWLMEEGDLFMLMEMYTRVNG